jgi:hypothetical protein
VSLNRRRPTQGVWVPRRIEPKHSRLPRVPLRRDPVPVPSPIHAPGARHSCRSYSSLTRRVKKRRKQKPSRTGIRTRVPAAPRAPPREVRGSPERCIIPVPRIPGPPLGPDAPPARPERVALCAPPSPVRPPFPRHSSTIAGLARVRRAVSSKPGHGELRGSLARIVFQSVNKKKNEGKQKGPVSGVEPASPLHPGSPPRQVGGPPGHHRAPSPRIPGPPLDPGAPTARP